MPHLTVYRTYFTDVEDGDYVDPSTEEDTIDCTPDRFEAADGLTPIDIAVEFLTNEALTEPSSCPGFHPGIWWSYVDGSYITNYYTGERVAESAHLDGFTPDEEERIWEFVTGKKAA